MLPRPDGSALGAPNCVVCGRHEAAHDPNSGRLRSRHRFMPSWAAVRAAERAGEPAHVDSQRGHAYAGVVERRERDRDRKRRARALAGGAA